jgi:hypothetical protein
MQIEENASFEGFVIHVSAQTVFQKRRVCHESIQYSNLSKAAFLVKDQLLEKKKNLRCFCYLESKYESVTHNKICKSGKIPFVCFLLLYKLKRFIQISLLWYSTLQMKGR